MAADLIDWPMWLVPVMFGEITLALSRTLKTGLRGRQGRRHAWQEIPRVHSTRLQALDSGAELSGPVEVGAFVMGWRALCKWVHSSQARGDCNVWTGCTGASDLSRDSDHSCVMTVMKDDRGDMLLLLLHEKIIVHETRDAQPQGLLMQARNGDRDRLAEPWSASATFHYSLVREQGCLTMGRVTRGAQELNAKWLALLAQDITFRSEGTHLA